MERDVKIQVDTADGSFIIDKTEYEKFGRNYIQMFTKLHDELKDDDRIKTIIFGYDDSLRGNTIQLLTTRCTQFRPNITFETDHSNDNEVVNKLLSDWKSLPKEESEKVQYTGIFKRNNKKISFNRMYGTYMFSDEECEALLKGLYIEFEMTTSYGKDMFFCGRLAEQEYKGFKFYGFKKEGYALGDKVFGVKLTDKEKQTLRNGGKVWLENMYAPKKKKYFNASVSYTPQGGIKIENY